MPSTEIILLFIALIAVIVMTQAFPRRNTVCNRCNGTGQVDERWPDPKEPTGWHDVHGRCPKCGGKGKI